MIKVVQVVVIVEAEVVCMFMPEMDLARLARAVAMDEESVICWLRLLAQRVREESESKILEDGEKYFF